MSGQWRKGRTPIRTLQFLQVVAENLAQHLGRHFQFIALHVFGDFVGSVQRVFGAVDRGHFQHDVRLHVIGRHAFAMEEHAAQLELRLGMALQRGFLEEAQGLVQVAGRVFVVQRRVNQATSA